MTLFAHWFCLKYPKRIRTDGTVARFSPETYGYRAFTYSAISQECSEKFRNKKINIHVFRFCGLEKHIKRSQLHKVRLRCNLRYRLFAGVEAEVPRVIFLAGFAFFDTKYVFALNYL